MPDKLALASTVDDGLDSSVRALNFVELTTQLAEASVTRDVTRITGVLQTMLKGDPEKTAQFLDDFALMIPDTDPGRTMFQRLAEVARKLSRAATPGPRETT
jgi:hypothetical protein